MFSCLYVGILYPVGICGSLGKPEDLKMLCLGGKKRWTLGFEYAYHVVHETIDIFVCDFLRQGMSDPGKVVG